MGKQKRQVLIISFDYIRPGEPKEPYSIATLMAFLESKPQFNNFFQVKHISHNLFLNGIQLENLDKYIPKYIAKYSFVALGAYIWSDGVVMKLLPLIRQKAPEITIILGGYQLNNYYNPDELREIYPDANYFIQGLGEKSLFKVITEMPSDWLIQNTDKTLIDLPSPYLKGHITLTDKVRKIRMETKRGCPHKCEYCDWRKISKEIMPFSLSRFEKELEYIAQFPVDKVNLLDGTFNDRNSNYLSTVELMAKYPHILFSVQTYPNSITEEFIQRCAEAGNIYLEIGIQTIFKNEMKVLNRFNNMEHVFKSLKLLMQSKVPFEINLIYGIPGAQTLKSFMSGIIELLEFGLEPQQIKSYHLQVPHGSTLENEQNMLYTEKEHPLDMILEPVSQTIGYDELFKGKFEPKYRLAKLRKHLRSQIIAKNLIKQSPSFSDLELLGMRFMAGLLQFSRTDKNTVEMPLDHAKENYKFARISFLSGRKIIRVRNNIKHIDYIIQYQRKGPDAYVLSAPKPIDLLSSFFFLKKPVDAYIVIENNVYSVKRMKVNNDTLKLELDVDSNPVNKKFILHYQQ